MSTVDQNQKKPAKKYVSILLWVIFLSIILFLLLYRLDTWPSLFWDEGWTLDAARNWIVSGHLGHFLDGQPIPPRIPVRFVEVVLVTVSMKVLGIGTWQGRLPIVLTTVSSLGLVYYLSSQIFNRKIGSAAIFFIFLFSVFIYHPLVIGRMVMAEMPMMFFLLGGFSFLWLALTRSPIWIIGSALFLGIGIQAKLQVPPFLIISFSLGLISSIILRMQKSIKILIMTTAGSLLVFILAFILQNRLMPGSFNDSELIKLLFNSVIFVFNKNIRFQAMIQVLLFGAPLVLSFIWSAVQIVKIHRNFKDQSISQLSEIDINKIIIRSALLGLGASWLLWYIFMAVTYIRYLFPPLFIGSIFVAHYIYELTNGFDFRIFVKKIYSLLIKREFRLLNIQVLLMFLALCIGLSSSLTTFQIGLSLSPDDPILAANYLRENIPAGARLETFESEILFLAPEYSYHFPSDLVSMEAQREYIDPTYPIKYDPIGSKPEYIIVGPMGHLWPIYTEVVKGKQSNLVADVGNYQIYHIEYVNSNK